MDALGIAGIGLISVGIVLLLAGVLPLFIRYVRRLPESERRRLSWAAAAYGGVCLGSLLVMASFAGGGLTKIWIAWFAVLMPIFGSLLLLQQLLSTLHSAEGRKS